MSTALAHREPRRSALGVLPYFDALHPGPSWRPWRVFVSAVYGEPLSAERPLLEADDEDVVVLGPETESELDLFRRFTGRQEPREGGYPEAVCIVGVQSGKSSVVAALASHAALTGEPGTHALMIAQDYRSSQRALLTYARAPFQTIPAFRREVERETADTTELRNGVFLSAYPSRPESVRGVRACIVAIDELAFFTSTDGRPTDREMLRVARGRVANTGGRVIVLSSPYGQFGTLYDLHRRHYGKEDSPVLVWQATAPAMNPTLSADYLERMRTEDPEAAVSEIEGQFRAGVSTFLDPEALTAVVDTGVRERPPSRASSYYGYVDAASGSGKDAFAVGIAHRDGQRAVLDVVRAWRPPFNPSGVIAEAADLLKRYGIDRVSGDRYAPGFVAEGFRGSGITYEPAEFTTSQTYLEFLPLANSGAVRLLDEPHLLRELRGLERRRGAAGRDRVDHRPGSHDDRAVAAAGALVAASEPAQEELSLTW